MFREIVRPERLVFVLSFSDERGGVTRHPLIADWPVETLSTVTFAQHAGIGRGTTVIIEWAPLNATERERAVFAENHPSMERGWSGTTEVLAAYLATLGPRRAA